MWFEKPRNPQNYSLMRFVYWQKKKTTMIMCKKKKDNSS